MSDEIKRQTAYKCSIETLNKGIFVKRPGWESNYLMTDYGDFSRVNIIAVVVSKEDNSITLDDGTGKIIARTFDKPEMLLKVQIGDPVIIIGRPREYNNNIYLTIDIIKKIKDIEWINYRKKELSLIKKIRNVDKKNIINDAVIIESQNTITNKEKIIALIKNLDSGSGADIEDIIKYSKIKNAEEIIKDFILKGEVFEIKPGKIKLM
ncbi:MAG: hypothetical protein QXK76_01310 [Candidatus Woesearchaeota archaeon]